MKHTGLSAMADFEEADESGDNDYNLGICTPATHAAGTCECGMGPLAEETLAERLGQTLAVQDAIDTAWNKGTKRNTYRLVLLAQEFADKDASEAFIASYNRNYDLVLAKESS